MLPTPIEVLDLGGETCGTCNGTREELIIVHGPEWEMRVVPVSAIAAVNPGAKKLRLNVTIDAFKAMERAFAAL